ncbi:hypothetical protein WA026_009292 [Henosepilachna vigintioctopunctata]|uniref:Uncharacterized protein n=1 Tax=Henosepilachna vigintioctopunctata TaxID=420089 RepID=A0AAW1UVZ9_9CUCU
MEDTWNGIPGGTSMSISKSCSTLQPKLLVSIRYERVNPTGFTVYATAEHELTSVPSLVRFLGLIWDTTPSTGPRSLRRSSRQIIPTSSEKRGPSSGGASAA